MGRDKVMVKLLYLELEIDRVMQKDTQAWSERALLDFEPTLEVGTRLEFNDLFSGASGKIYICRSTPIGDKYEVEFVGDGPLEIFGAERCLLNLSLGTLNINTCFVAGIGRDIAHKR